MTSQASIIAALTSHNESILLNIINDNPTWDSIHDLAYGVIKVAQSHPTDVEKIVNTIIAVRDALDAPAINSNDSAGQPTKRELSDLLSREIYEMLTSAFDTTDQEISSINPQNPLLISAMISGACARSQLCNSAAQAGMVTRGLQFKDSDYDSYLTPDNYEVNALHACLQLLVGGSAGYTSDQMGYEKEGMLPALKSIASKDIIKSANGKNLLQVRSSRS